uniref:Uncharacterized protein n=1 Tax=Ditylenchus dipsaci TaxID=166011 RepID=A0A915DI44_9BILA
MADYIALFVYILFVCLYTVFGGPLKFVWSRITRRVFIPLSTAFNQLNRPRAHSSSLNKTPAAGLRPQQAQILVDFGDVTIDNQHQGRDEHAKNLLTPTFSNDSNGNKPKHSQWLEWTRWSGCNNGERIRLRQCLEVNNVKCQGENVQSQKCFSFQHSDIPFAKDPLTIEKKLWAPHYYYRHFKPLDLTHPPPSSAPTSSQRQ